MGTHFHEHHADIVRWPWKVFCRKWARLAHATVDERRQDLRRKRKMLEARRGQEMGEMRAAHREYHGGGLGG